MYTNKSSRRNMNAYCCFIVMMLFCIMCMPLAYKKKIYKHHNIKPVEQVSLHNIDTPAQRLANAITGMVGTKKRG